MSDDRHDIDGIEELGVSGHKKGRVVSRYVRVLLLAVLIGVALVVVAIYFGGAHAVPTAHH